MKPFCIILCCSLLGISCGQSHKAGTTKEEARKLDMQNAIENKRWVLQKMNGTQVPKGDRDIYITFKNASAFVGNGGCNGFSGHYKMDSKTISLTDIVSTKMACPSLETETTFFEILRRANGYKIMQDHFSLMDGNDEIATFDAVYLK